MIKSSEKEELGKLVREADNRLIDGLDKIEGNKSLDNRIIRTSIKGKAIAEDLGIISKDMFVKGSGNKKKR